MFKEMAAIANLMKNAPQIAGEANAMKERLAALRIVGRHEGVQVQVTGDHKIISVTIAEELHSLGDRALLETRITAACNVALQQAREAVAQEVSGVASGLGISGLTDALSQLGIGR